MTPYERIEAAYAANPKEEPFVNYVVWHHRHGFVFSRPDCFVMGRAVVRSAPAEKIRDLSNLFPSSDCDAWYIHAAAGNLSRMWSLMPWPLGWIGFTRLSDPSSELRFFPAETLKRLCPPELSALE